jgi:hypothetical protein
MEQQRAADQMCRNQKDPIPNLRPAKSGDLWVSVRNFL